MLRIEEADSFSVALANAIYAEIHFEPSVLARDRSFLGHEGSDPVCSPSELVCLGRLNRYADALELGGFWVRPDRRARGYARQIVGHVLSQVPAGEVVYCLPFVALVPFYASFGLLPADESQLPGSVAAKLALCRARYLEGTYSSEVSVLLRLS